MNILKKQLMTQYGVSFSIEPYNYELYRKINPKLTKSMYDFLRGNKSLWKVECGKRVTMDFGNEVLEAEWWLDTLTKYENRFLS